jgi:hypothetical protein
MIIVFVILIGLTELGIFGMLFWHLTKKYNQLKEKQFLLQSGFQKIIEVSKGLCVVYKEAAEKIELNEQNLLKLQQDVLLFMTTVEEIVFRKDNESVDVEKIDKQKLN